jgi:hypothetical protein
MHADVCTHAIGSMSLHNEQQGNPCAGLASPGKPAACGSCVDDTSKQAQKMIYTSVDMDTGVERAM